ncbi:MAG: DUF1566 domain-containing protein [Magnetococcus sp. YQC-5]
MKDKIKIFRKWFTENNIYVFILLFSFFPFCLLADEVSGPVSQTGQTLLHAIGDDAELRRGMPWPTPRFKDNGDGTVTDHLTSLVWMKNADCFGQQTWADAFIKVAGLNSNKETCVVYTNKTYTDWRVPNIQELSSLIDFGQFLPALSTDSPFVGAHSDRYWSSTASASSPSYAWFVDLYNGSVEHYAKANTYYVWPVRGRQ